MANEGQGDGERGMMQAPHVVSGEPWLTTSHEDPVLPSTAPASCSMAAESLSPSSPSEEGENERKLETSLGPKAASRNSAAAAASPASSMLALVLLRSLENGLSRGDDTSLAGLGRRTVSERLTSAPRLGFEVGGRSGGATAPASNGLSCLAVTPNPTMRCGVGAIIWA